MLKKPFAFVIGITVIVLASVYLLGVIKDPDPQSHGLEDKTIPHLDLPLLKIGSQERLTKDSFKGRRVILHFFASWCKYCREEHPLMKTLSTRPNVILFGVNVHDKREEAISWLEEDGDPYEKVGFDEKGEVALAWGVMATPQTFVINEQGRIIYQYSGSLTSDRIKEKILPLFK